MIAEQNLVSIFSSIIKSDWQKHQTKPDRHWSQHRFKILKCKRTTNTFYV